MLEPVSSAAGLHPIVVTGIGMTTPVGAQATQTLTSIRAGIARLTEYSAFEPPATDPSLQFPEPLIAGQGWGLEESLPLALRLLELAVPALTWAVDDATGRGARALGRTSLLVFGGEVPATRVGTRIAQTFVQRLAARVEGLESVQSSYSDTGAVGFVRGLAAASETLMSGAADTVVLGAVDSLLSAETLGYFADQVRLRTEGNPVGFVPGEAAAFVVLEHEARATTAGGAAYARLGGVASAMERNPIHSEDVCTGVVLASCLADVLGQMGSAGLVPRSTYCDLNGETHASQEWGLALNHLAAAGLELPEALVHPADCMGDVGAAMGGVLACLGADSTRRQMEAWVPPIIWCASDAGPRAAAYLTRV